MKRDGYGNPTQKQHPMCRNYRKSTKREGGREHLKPAIAKGLCNDCLVEEYDRIHNRYILRQDWRTPVDILRIFIKMGVVTPSEVDTALYGDKGNREKSSW